MTREEIALSTARHVAGALDGGTFIVLVLNPDGSASSSISTVNGVEVPAMHPLVIAGSAHLELSSLIESACRRREEDAEEEEAS
jgi:hypothetical protein